MSKIHIPALMALCLAAAPAFASEGHGHGGAAHFTFGSPAKLSAATRTVAVSMGDMSFTPASLSVKAGEVVRFDVTNSSSVDHDFTLGDTGVQAAHRKEMAEMAGMHHGDDPNAVMVMAGQSRSLAWKFDKPGTVEFDCNVPGHYESGMAGTITVTP